MSKTNVNDRILEAIGQVGQKLDGLAAKVDGIDRRVTALEQPVTLKPRVVASNGNGHALARPVSQPSPAPARGEATQGGATVRHRPDDDDGEDEAIRGGAWEKVVKTKPCNRISITKTRKRDAWKILLHMPGLRRPATFIAWDGPQDAVEFFAEVLPWLSLDYFDEDGWTAQDSGQGTAPIFFQQEVNFLADWFKTAPNERGHTFVNVEAIYPIYEA